MSTHGQPLQWFDEFFKTCNGTCKIDYLATHHYGCNTNDAMNYINSLRNNSIAC